MTAIVATPASAPSPLRIGSSINTAVRVFAEGWWKFILLTLIPMGPYYVYSFLTEPATIAEARSGAISSGAYLGDLAIKYAFVLVLSALATAACISGAQQILRGANFSLAEAFKQGLRRLAPALGASLLAVLAMALGSIIFIVPGLIALATFFVALPAVVIERMGPVASLARSRRLTKGARWKCLGVIALAYLALIVADALFGGIGAAIDGLYGYRLGAVAPPIVFSAFFSVLTTVVYHDLRRAKEGIGGDTLAGVFE